MRYPEFLKDNGRIGTIAPSFGCNTEPYASLFDEAIKRFEEKGYSVVEGPNSRLGKGIGKSNVPEECGAEINDFFIGDCSDVVISCGGGETMCEDLGFIDFDSIAVSRPKWFMGYSDNTNLVLTLPTLCDTAAVYGPNVSSFGQRPWHRSIEDALSLLRGEYLTVRSYEKWEKESADEDIYAPYNCTEDPCIKLAGSASGSESANFSGRLLGGCIDCLSLLCGTRFDRVKDFAERYKDDGVIWFLESCELTSVGNRRALWGFKEAGWFENVRGFIIGRPYMMDDVSFGLTQERAFADALSEFNVPVILNADIGHLPPQMPLIAGAFANVSADSGGLTVEHILE